MKSELDLALEALHRIQCGSMLLTDFTMVRQALEYSRDAFKWLYVFNKVVPGTKGLDLIPMLTDEDVQEIDDYGSIIRSGSRR